ncbi:hypothetical protein FO519_003518 [Halicephalobus sp. NKZ332]|nr:hypothetical protein FO519_003518 [Halicephalobus sp. NKZ332]
MEKKHVLPKDEPRAGDCVFFDASNSNGWWFTLGMAQRQNDIINLFCIVKVPGLGTFVNEELPSSSNVKALKDGEEYKTESGFRIRCLEPMRKWHVSFEGSLVPGQYCQPNTKISGSDPELDFSVNKIPAHYDLIWESRGEYFDFDSECSPEAIGRSIAMEPWSKELFEKMKSTHQTHYEQFGTLTGKFRIGEYQTPENVQMISMRDHTITKYRNWSQLRRYIMIIYHLDDGTCIHTSLISMPETAFSHLQFGYVLTPDLKKIPVDHIDLHLADIGENKTFPKSFSYSFRAGNLKYDVQVKVIDTIKFKMGLDLQCYVEENMCEFKANGILGHGFAEAEYRIEPY